MRYSVNVKTAPAAEPISRAEAKLHLRVDDDDTGQDSLVDALIVAAREWVENYCRRSLVSRTLELRLDTWPREIRLPRGPVSEVTSIVYADAGGSSATLAADQYQVDLYATPPRIVPAFGVVWPVLKEGEINAVVVEYVAGYAPDTGVSPEEPAGNVPSAIKAAMKLIVGHLYEHRELVTAAGALTEMPFAVKALLSQYEVRDYTLE